MSHRRIILPAILCAIWYLIPTISVTLGQDAPPTLSKDGVKKEPVPPDSLGSNVTQDGHNQTKESTRDIALNTLDQVIDNLKRTGDAEAVADLQAYREQFSNEDETQCTIEVGMYACKMVQQLRKRSELLSARQMIPHTLQIADSVKTQAQRLFIYAHCEAAFVDEDFERYDAALKHASLAREVANEGNVKRRDAIVLKANYARILRNLKRFNEAEKLYLDLVEQTTKDSDGLSQLDLFDLHFSLAITYAQKGAFDKYLKAFPAEGLKKQVDEDDARFADRIVLINSAAVNWAVLEGRLDLAERKAQKELDWSQEYFGVSSRPHVEANELLAKVRVAQEKNDEAIVLLKKSADLRARLLGEEHPSISRLHKEIDAIRKKQLDNSEPIWTRPNNGDESLSADRYGTAKPVGGVK
jgi:tetratricopeptide (TPR) repeat protein